MCLRTDVPPRGSLEQRSTVLADQIREHVPTGKVHLIAHSMGGLDTRYLVSHKNGRDLIATLTTLGSPFQGTLAADIAGDPGLLSQVNSGKLLQAIARYEFQTSLKWPSIANADTRFALVELRELVANHAAGGSLMQLHQYFSGLFTLDDAALRELRTENCRKLFSDPRDLDGIPCYSYAGSLEPSSVSPALVVPALVLAAAGEPNDGIVPVASAFLPVSKDILPIDHLGLVGWTPTSVEADLRRDLSDAQNYKCLTTLSTGAPEFPILANTTYMISHSLGAMPRRTRDRLNEFADTWATRGIRAWEEGWWDLPVTVGNLIGSLIGAGPGEVVMHQNVSVCLSVILSCFDWQDRRNKIVTEALNFPSTLYLLQGVERQGARLVTVPSNDGITVPLEHMLAAIDDETRLVSISHVIFKSSFVQDLRAIIDKAHSVGAMVVADLYQSTGTVPVDVGALQMDFATGGSVKWLCGGPGAAYLYVRPDLWPALKPAVTGWQAHREPFAFDAGRDGLRTRCVPVPERDTERSCALFGAFRV